MIITIGVVIMIIIIMISLIHIMIIVSTLAALVVVVVVAVVSCWEHVGCAGCLAWTPYRASDGFLKRLGAPQTTNNFVY